MSIAELPKRTQKRPTMPKERRERQIAVRLTAEEIDRLTEPGHRKRVTELGRELVQRIMNRQANGGNADD